ncbi:MAG: glycosyltransferase family 4 protein [Nitrososphaerota archaeon]|nr:glycosyltransferase family 4 protein [Nitrososphaerota archaeon]
MKILWASHRDIRNPKAGGSERLIYEVAKRLVHQGHDITWLTGGWKGAGKSENIDGISVRRYYGKLWPHLALPFVIHDIADLDVIVDDLSHALPWLSPVMTSTPGVAHFYHMHAKTLSGQVSYPISLILSKVEQVYSTVYRDWPFVTISESSKTDLERLGIDRNMIAVIHPGVDTNLFRPGDKAPFPQMIYFGGMRPYKRPEHAIYVLGNLIREGIASRLVMVGDGPSLPMLRKIAREMGLDDKITFTGKVSDERLAAIVRESWINIHCSVSEGWCLSAMEAAASGVPTTGYSVAGLKESVEEGVSGILVEDGNIAALSSAIRNIIENRQDYASRCRKHAEQFSWDNAAKMWEQNLMNAIEQS